MPISDKYSEMLRGVWTPEERRQMKQSAQQYRECVRQAWKKGGVTKAELEACARQAGIPERYRAIIVGGL